MRQPVTLDLFCGAGGLSLGFQMAGYDIRLGIDHDATACGTYAHNFGNGVEVDIQTITDPLEFVHEHGLDEVDVVIGGPPCQGFSRVGRGKLRQVKNDPNYIDDPRNSLFRDYLRFVARLRPLYVVIENVPDMKHYRENGTWVLDLLISELRSLGYSTVDSRALLAADYGVPQRRQRLFVIANRVGIPITWPKPTYEPTKHVTVWEAISDLPIVGTKHREDEMPYISRQGPNEYQRRMREGSDGILYNHQTRWHNDDDIRAFVLLQEGEKYINLPDALRRYDSKQHPEKRNEWFRDRYRKLERGKPSWTVEAHIGKDTYRHIYPSRVGEPEPPRTISVREAARLQSFPDTFRFVGAFTNQFHQVGNAVPPLLAKAVASAILPDVQKAITDHEQERIGTPDLSAKDTAIAAELPPTE